MQYSSSVIFLLHLYIDEEDDLSQLPLPEMKGYIFPSLPRDALQTGLLSKAASAAKKSQLRSSEGS